MFKVTALIRGRRDSRSHRQQTTNEGGAGMRRYQRNRMTGRTRKLVIGATALALAGGAFAISTGVSSAGENCVGLDQALRQNLEFIAGQRATPDALSDARI